MTSSEIGKVTALLPFRDRRKSGGISIDFAYRREVKMRVHARPVYGGKVFPLLRANENIRATKTIGRTGGWKFEKFGVGVSRPVPPPCGHFVKGVVIFPLESRHYDNSQSL